MAPRKPAKAAGTKTYILELNNGDTRKMTIPDNWKLTFGHLIPPSNDTDRGVRRNGGPALRIYEGSKENLRAVMTDVVAIRDSSIQIMEKRTTIQRKAAQKDTHGGRKDVVVEARVTEWVNPDAGDDPSGPLEDFTKLPSNFGFDD